MKKALLTALIFIVTSVGLCACSDGEIEVPDGLQIVKISEDEGYHLFGPEGWVVANDGSIAASYVSTINSTSITFTKAKAPEGTYEEYFNREIAKFAYDITILDGEAAKPIAFGNADEAVSYVYTFEYGGVSLASWQILIKNDGEFYIFTYTSYGDPTDEESDYQYYLEVVSLAVDSFEFVEKSGASDKAEPTGEWVLTSDKSLSGFELYLPDTYLTENVGGIVKAMISDKASLSLTKASTTGVSILEYIEQRKSELESLFGEVSDIAIKLETLPDMSGENADMFSSFDISPTADPDITFGNLEKNRIIRYEYSYTYNGRVYRTCQLFGVSRWDGFVFTYTAEESEYGTHIDEIERILQEVKF
ncbi:MAG: DcrB-related protein [Clostridia bacterium]|nr:DcrB-related protein [Clostridia bacterium]